MLRNLHDGGFHFLEIELVAELFIKKFIGQSLFVNNKRLVLT